MGPINLIKMHSALTAAHLFTWALLAAAIFILEEGTRLVRDWAEGRAAEEGKPDSGEMEPSSAAH